MTADSRDLLTLIAVGLGFAALFGIHLTVVLTDIRRELTLIRREVRTTTSAVREVAADSRQRAIVVALDPEPTEETE